MSFGIPVRNGLSIGIGTLVSLTSGSGVGGRSRRGEPTLILDFVPSDPVYDYTLATNFLTEQYEVYATDPTAPGYVILKVWE
jgi:hypothetical protein